MSCTSSDFFESAEKWSPTLLPWEAAGVRLEKTVLRNINIVQNHTPDSTSIRKVAGEHFPKVLRRTGEQN